MAFYHWLGPAVKGWTSGKKEKEEHDLESSLKRIKMQQLVDEMMTNQARFGQEQKGWAAQDAKNAYDVRDYAPGGRREKMTDAELADRILQQDLRRQELKRNPEKWKLEDSESNARIAGLGFDNDKKKVDASWAERENQANYDQKRASAAASWHAARAPYRTGNSESDRPIPIPEVTKQVEKLAWDIQQSILNTPGGVAAYLEEHPEHTGVIENGKVNQQKLAEAMGVGHAFIPSEMILNARTNAKSIIANGPKILAGTPDRADHSDISTPPGQKPPIGAPAPAPAPQQSGMMDKMSELARQFADNIKWTPEESQRFRTLVSMGVPEDQARMVIINERINPTKSSGNFGDLFRGAASVLKTPPKPMNFGYGR